MHDLLGQQLAKVSYECFRDTRIVVVQRTATQYVEGTKESLFDFLLRAEITVKERYHAQDRPLYLPFCSIKKSWILGREGMKEHPL